MTEHDDIERFELLPEEGEPGPAPEPDPAPAPGPEPLGYAVEQDERPSMSYWAIVTGQFRKNRLASWSLRVLLAMYLVAVYAPFLSFRIPFVYVDDLRQTLKEGDRIEVGSMTLRIVREEAPTGTAVKKGSWIQNRLGLAPTAPALYFLEREGERIQIRFRLSVGCGEGCAVRDDVLSENHAEFGLFAGRPFVRETSGGRTVKVNGALLGETRFPFFRSLFDRNEFEMNVDRFFNFMVFAVPVLLLLYLLAGRMAAAAGMGLARIRSLGLLGGTAVMVLGYFFIAMFPVSDPYRDYRLELFQGGADLTSASPVVSTEHRWALFPPIPRSYRDQNADIRTKAPWKDVEQDLVLAPLRAGGGAPEKGEAGKKSLWKTLYIFGTDDEGRDVFTRLIYGTRISLTIGVFAVAIYVAIGVFLGGLAGFFGGWVDILVMRFIEIMMCFPTFFLILTLIAILESRSIFWIMLIIGVTGWTGVARLVRGEFLKQKSIDYVTAATALGVGRMKIMFKHILPNAMAPVLVAATFGIAGAILTETGLSFLGLGDTRAPSWGQLLVAGRKSQEYYLILLSGLSIFFTVTILNLVGEGVRDALDPKLRK